jgi:cold-inducible RNA-binding protein
VILFRGRLTPDLFHARSIAGVIVRRKMESKLYVGNLSYSTTEDDLRNLFFQAGTVASVALIKDRDSGRSKGFAFVEMSNQAEAQKAISMFNGHNMGDRELRVSLARPREERSGFPDRGSGHSRRPAQRGGNKRY